VSPHWPGASLNAPNAPSDPRHPGPRQDAALGPAGAPLTARPPPSFILEFEHERDTYNPLYRPARRTQS